MKLDLGRYNQRIKAASKEVLGDIKNEASAMGVEHRENSPSPGSSVAAMKDKYKEHDGAVDVISFKLRRTLIYTHKGAGKGRGGTKGSSWVDRYGATKTTNPKSFGKMGGGGRVAKPFINTVLDSGRGVEKIALIAAEELGDAIVNNMFVK